ncbi:unnamed protein product [Didymodactylos carnosus]|uniref:C3H1-type domain-containing protein n=1 Tax=Didymodactylos carnosus TaxID=1234261 RepID=A0A814HM03_9BILA|nr:unnamed protein product [Didymodactylos carnosus]CAF3782788.1 unnamed protein product [Didymodactylos carnosus]
MSTISSNRFEDCIFDMIHNEKNMNDECFCTPQDIFSCVFGETSNNFEIDDISRATHNMNIVGSKAYSKAVGGPVVDGIFDGRQIITSTSTLDLNSNNNKSSSAARYKTELCRSFQETGLCKYDTKCQFAHGHDEIRSLHRHPKYKTVLCLILQDSASTKSAMSSNDGVNYGVFSSSMSSHSISPRSISPSNSPTTSASSECGSDDDSSITGYRQHSHQLQQPSQYTRIHSDSSSIDDYTYYHVSLN